MKMNLKRFLIIALVSLLAFSITGCGKESGNNDPDNPLVTDPVVEPKDNDEIKNLKLDWWNIYNPNGINTLTMQLTNPNSFDVDFLLTASYYSNGTKVGEAEGLYGNAIKGGAEALIWYNWAVPENVDDIKVEFTYLDKSYYKSAKATITQQEKKENGVFLDFKVDGDCSNGIVYVVFYDGDKFVSSTWKDFYQFTDMGYLYEAFAPFTDYKIYTNFY